MLQSLNDLGYAVSEVINAADYGMPQRRRRVFFLGYKKDSKVYKQLKKSIPVDWLLKDRVIQNTFKAQDSEVHLFLITTWWISLIISMLVARSHFLKTRG